MLIYTRSLLRSAIGSVFRRNSRNFGKSCGNCSPSRAYDGEGKTTVNILNREAELGIMIDGISQVGFRLNNGITILGPIIIFPRCVLSWCVQNTDEITEDSLKLFGVLEPKIDILIIGTGDSLNSSKFHQTLIPFARKHRFSLEILPTEHACTTFNFLNSEGRYSGAALLPPTTLHTSDDDVMKTKLRYQNLYVLED